MTRTRTAPLLRTPRVVGALALALALLAPALAEAQSKSDAFAGKIPPVSANLYRKAGRWEGTLSANLSLNDAFYSKYFGGLKLGYHFTESWSAHGYVAGGLTTKAGSAQVCPSGGGCHSADEVDMNQVPGKIKLMSGVEGAWSPIYGKLNFFSEKVGHFDLSVILGADWISYQEVLSKGDAEALATSGGTPGTTSSIGAHVGLGTRFFLSESIALRIELRDYLYNVDVPNTGGKDLQNQLFFELGISCFFPTHNRPVQ
jgi:outer membrane beta-barrel protein